jgi:hypothetical protein
MSNFVLCKGNSSLFSLYNFKIIKYPFDNEYLKKASEYFWSGEEINDIWSVIDFQASEIDSYFTNAQRELSISAVLSDTKLYELLNKIICSAIDTVIWYSDFTEDIPVFTEKEVFFDTVKQQLMEPSCEVYARYIR